MLPDGERLAVPPVGSRLQRVEGNPTTAPCAAPRTSQTMRHFPTVLLFGTFIAHRRNCTARYVRGCVSAYEDASLWCQGLVRCARHEATARALQRPVYRELPIRRTEPPRIPCPATAYSPPGRRAAGRPACRRAFLCLPAFAYLVALYVMLCWTVSCRAASAS